MFLTNTKGMWKKGWEWISPDMFSGNSIALLDDDVIFLSKMVSIYNEIPNIRFQAFHYPTDNAKFFNVIGDMSFVIVGYELGGVNGANVMKGMLCNGLLCKILLVTDNEDAANRCRGFKYFIHKNKLLQDPEFVLRLNGTSIDQAVEIAVLAKQTGSVGRRTAQHAYAI